MIFRTKKKSANAFTFVELLIGVALLAILSTIAIQALGSSRSDALSSTASANATTLNEGIVRAQLKGDKNPILSGSDEVALASYLIFQGYIRSN